MISDDTSFKDFSGNDYSQEQFIEMIKKYNQDGYSFYIGTDSQILDDYINIVTAICPRKINSFYGISGKVFYTKTRVPKKDYSSLRARMLMEAYKSLEMAMALDQHTDSKICIHLDVASDNNSKSNLYQKELQYLVTSQGYECKIKPDSWMASACADRMSR
jgi:hypothetical protein